MLSSFRPKTSIQPHWSTASPRPAAKKATTIDLLHINLHQQRDIHRSVNDAEVSTMRQMIEKHDEVTNEVFNLMGAQI